MKHHLGIRDLSAAIGDVEYEEHDTEKGELRRAAQRQVMARSRITFHFQHGLRCRMLRRVVQWAHVDPPNNERSQKGQHKLPWPK